MSAATAVLRIGSMIHHDGAAWTVVEFAGRRLLLSRHGDGELRQVDVGWLLTHPSTQVSASPAVLDLPGAAFSSLDPGQAEQLRVLVQHLQELLTGYRLGDKALAQPGEPRPPYRPRVSK